MSHRKVSKWELTPIRIFKGKKTECLKHWEKVGSEGVSPPSDVSLHPTCVIEYTEDEYVAAKCKVDSWDKKCTDYLFSLCRK